MLQRTLYTVVSQGLEAFRQNPMLYQRLFGDQWGLSAAEVEGIAKTFALKPVSIKHGYALADFSPPQVTILLQSEAQTDFALGDYVGQGTYVQADGTLMQAAQLGAFWDANYQLLVATENPDASSYLYEMVKATLVFSKAALEAADITDPVLSGMDLAPDARYFPEHLFVRALSLRCKTRFVVPDFEGALQKVLHVSGIALPNATGQSNGGAQTLVTPTQVQTSEP